MNIKNKKTLFNKLKIEKTLKKINITILNDIYLFVYIDIFWNFTFINHTSLGLLSLNLY